MSSCVAKHRFRTLALGALLVVGAGSGFGGHGTASPRTPTPPGVSRAAIGASETSLTGGARTLHPFRPLSFTAISDRNYWLLGTAGCARPDCLAILHTTDGGRRFLRVNAPSLPTVGTVPTLRFADARNGFAYVQGVRGRLYRTHDGGESWKRLSVGTLLAFATSGGNAYLVTASCTVSRCANYRLERSPLFADRWSSVPTPLTSAASIDGLAARGPKLWLLAWAPTKHHREHEILLRSSDRGRTFTTEPGPCIPELGGDLEPTSARVVWAICPTGLLARAWRSSDGGATFRPLAVDRLANSAVLAPASDTTAVLAPNGAGAPLLRTTNGGRSWQAVPGTTKVSDWGFIGFTDTRTGSAIVQVDGARIASLWRTRDGGAGWSNVSIHVPAVR